MNLTEFIEKWGKTLFENPLATTVHPDDPPELAEIRLAVLDEIRQKSYRAGARKVFPFDLIRVEMRGVEESRAVVFNGGFFRKFLEQEIHNSLRADGARFPEQLRVEVTITTGLPLPNEPWLTVEASSQSPQPGEEQRIARLLVRQGDANTREIRIERANTYIGREIDVYRNKGLHRRNDLAFVEDTEINRSVSREHAHIQYDGKTGDYRLFNDRWHQRGSECGTWIVRDGISREVPRAGRGIKLESGDEIRFGQAVVVFEIGAAAEAARSSH